MDWQRLLASITAPSMMTSHRAMRICSGKLLCRTILQTLYGKRLKGVVLYGSCARGTPDTKSDIDLMVPLEGSVHAAEGIRRIWECLYPLQLESDRLLSVAR
jgi:predicted nucleotidyltransferase